MSAYSSYLGSKKCCNTSGAQGPQDHEDQADLLDLLV